MANSRRLTSRLFHSSPDRATRLRLSAIAEGCETKNGLAQPSRTTDSHTRRMAANDTIPRSTGADLQPAILIILLMAAPYRACIRSRSFSRCPQFFFQRSDGPRSRKSEHGNQQHVEEQVIGSEFRTVKHDLVSHARLRLVHLRDHNTQHRAAHS